MNKFNLKKIKIKYIKLTLKKSYLKIHAEAVLYFLIVSQSSSAEH